MSALPLGHVFWGWSTDSDVCMADAIGYQRRCGRPRSDHGPQSYKTSFDVVMEPSPVVPRPPQSDCLDLINAAVLREREACALAAEDYVEQMDFPSCSQSQAAYNVAAAIRAREGPPVTAPTPTHDVAWFLRERLPELAAMGTWSRYGGHGEAIRLNQGAVKSPCCPVSAPLGFPWADEQAAVLGLLPTAKVDLIQAADAMPGHDPAIRAALLAALAPERAR